MKRVILHIDMNSYFATVEQQANPRLRGRPIAVSGRPHIHSVVAAASVEAKKFGVKSGMSTWEAKKICPELIFLPGDPEKYIYLTGKLLGIFQSYTPLVEVFSIDEVWLELGNGADFSEAKRVAGDIKRRIRSELGSYLTCSVGIAHNKMLAKLASEKKKPDGLTIIDDDDLDEMLLSSKLSDFCGIGLQILARLNGMGVYSVGALRRIPPEYLVAAFGVRGKELHNLAYGVDESPVTADFVRDEPKSFSHNLTLDKGTTDDTKILAVTLRLAERVARRMRGEGFAGKTVSYFLRFTDLGGYGRQESLDYYTTDGLEIYRVCKKIKEEVSSGPNVRAVYVGIGNLIARKYLTIPLLPEAQRGEKIISSLDLVNNRFGENTIFRAAVLPVFSREKRVAGIRTRLRFN